MDGEEFGLQEDESAVHQEAAQVPDWRQPAAEEAPPPKLQKEDALQAAQPFPQQLLRHIEGCHQCMLLLTGRLLW